MPFSGHSTGPVLSVDQMKFRLKAFCHLRKAVFTVVLYFHVTLKLTWSTDSTGPVLCPNTLRLTTTGTYYNHRVKKTKKKMKCNQNSSLTEASLDTLTMQGCFLPLLRRLNTQNINFKFCFCCQVMSIIVPLAP